MGKSIRIYIVYLLGLILINISNVAQSNEEAIQANSINTYQSKNVIRVGLPDNKSLTYYQEAKLQLLINFTKEFWKIWGVDNHQKIEFIYLPLNSISQALADKSIDVATLGLKNQQSSNFLYSLPYAKYQQKLFKRIDSNKKNGIKIGIHSSNHKVLDFLNVNITREYFFSIEELITKHNNFDALYSSKPWVLKGLLEKKGLKDKFHISENEAPDIYFHFFTRANDRELAHKINDYLRSITEKQVDAWKDKYFSTHGQYFELTMGAYITSLSHAEKNYLLDHNYLKFPVTENGLPPYIITKNYAHITERGFVIDFTDMITQKTGLIFEPHYVNSLNLTAGIAGFMDILLHVSQADSTSKSLVYSTPYLKATYSIICRNQENPIYKLSDLKNKKVGVVQQYNLKPPVSNENISSHSLSFNTHEVALKALSQGEIDYLIADSLTSAYWIKEKQLANLMSHPITEGTDKALYGFATPYKNDALITLLNRTINEFPEAEFESLYHKWSRLAFHQSNAHEKIKHAYQKANYVIIGTLLIAIAVVWFFYRQYKIRSLQHQAIESALEFAESAKIEAEKSAQAKIVFLARMSHEIRTPMNGVLGMAEALSFTPLDNNQQELLDALNGSATNLLALLNDVLDFSKMDAGKLTLESVPVDFRILTQRILNGFKHVKQEKNIDVTLCLDENIAKNYYCDPTRLTQVLNNLMSNAIKFTNNGSVSLTLEHISQDKKNNAIYDTLKISVIDTGIGIPQDSQASLFTPFIQAEDDIARKFGGTGLGLSICHEIITAMGSTIHVISQENEGSTFSFSLQLKQATAEVNTQDRRKNLRVLNEPDDNRFKYLSVLIAEDNLINIQVLSAQLKRLNISADIAYDGEQALDMHKANHYDIIISDCQMPKMDGFELANILCNSKNHIPIWMIAVTADALKGASSKCLAAGFDDYMAKPCSQEQITNKLNHAFRQLQMKREDYLVKILRSAPYTLFDPHSLYLFNDNDLVLSRNLAEVFEQTWHKEKEKILSELANHNYSQVYALVHKQKSVIRYLCGDKLETYVLTVEKHTKSQHLPKTQKSCLQLIHQLDEMHSEISHWLSTINQSNRFIRLQ